VSSDSDLRALDADGREAPGVPKLTGGWVTGGAVFGRLGSMPNQVLVAGTREGELFVWQTGAPASEPSGAWPQVHQNLWNTGDYSGTPAPSGSGAVSPAAPSSSRCDQPDRTGVIRAARRPATADLCPRRSGSPTTG
jgi:hypothetical protein